MTSRPPRNVTASVRGRLLDRSRQTGEDFQFLLQRYAAERFLYRLGESVHRDRYVLKGAMLYALWGGSIYRPTRDLDFTGYGSNETDAVLAALREVIVVSAQVAGTEQFAQVTLRRGAETTMNVHLLPRMPSSDVGLLAST
jgi:hypothetical protein